MNEVSNVLDTGRPGDPRRRAEAAPSLRAKVEQSWPLFVAGAGCVAIAVVFALERTTHFVDHLSPTILFLAVGVTGVAGGIASFVLGPEEEEGELSGDSRDVRTVARRATSTPSTAIEAPDRWNGRPLPNVVPEWLESPPEAGQDTTDSWSEEGEAQESPPSLILDAGTYERPSPWGKGRLLRLSEEGTLTVYSLDDALRDLELVTEVVHGRRVHRIPSDRRT